jgi:V-type H+-transporting ATPase subunit F
LIGIIGDEETVTGFLLTGIGERNIKGETNFFIVDEHTTAQEIEDAFVRLI